MADYYYRRKTLYPDLQQEARDVGKTIEDYDQLVAETISCMHDLGTVLQHVIDKETSEACEEAARPHVKRLLIIAEQAKHLSGGYFAGATGNEKQKEKFAEVEKRFAHYFCPDRCFFYHFVYGIYAQIYYKLFYKPPELDTHRQHILKEMEERHFYNMDKEERGYLYDMLKPLYKTLDQHCEGKKPKNYRPLRYVVRKGYIASQYDQSNQIFLEKLEDSHLNNIKEAFVGLQFNKVLQHYYRSHYGISNVRVWRFFPKDKGGQDIRAHFDDGFPPNIIKIMAYAGDLQRDTGCFQVVTRKNKHVADIRGRKPAALVDTRQVRHRANAPKHGCHRDSVEITIMPMVHHETICVDSGCRTGSQLNPFRRWDEEASQIVSL